MNHSYSKLYSIILVLKYRTSLYHPLSNGIVERWHRSLTAALMCSSKPWIDVPSTVLRTHFKEDLQAILAEMLYGTNLRVPGEFFTTSDFSADLKIFVEKHREYELYAQLLLHIIHFYSLRFAITLKHNWKRFILIHTILKRISERIFQNLY